ncbi:MAG: hypothetical protein KAS38_20950 [Anaerolineales bacterium]|nr:hypothetical protein [Anaerolineales bacterium]
MKNAIRVVASLFGIFAGFGGIEHGYFEILQGNAKPESIMINSMGPPCQVDNVWHACEPAMTVIPNFFVTGILAITFGLITMIWAAAFVQRKNGGLVLILLSFVLLLVGGGIFPPLIGIIGGVVGTRINKPLTWWREHLSGKSLRLLAKLWPWTIILFFIWLFGQVLIGFFFNDFLLKTGMIIPVLILGLIILTVITAFAHDIQIQTDPFQAHPPSDKPTLEV